MSTIGAGLTLCAMSMSEGTGVLNTTLLWLLKPPAEDEEDEAAEEEAERGALCSEAAEEEERCWMVASMAANWARWQQHAAFMPSPIVYTSPQSRH